MLKFLLPVNESETSKQGVIGLTKLINWYKEVPEIHLLNVQLPLRGNALMFIDKENIEQYHQEEGARGLQSACDDLDRFGIAWQSYIMVGNPAESIVHYAEEKQCDQIILCSIDSGTVKGLLLGSVASRVMQLSTIPVLLIK